MSMYASRAMGRSLGAFSAFAGGGRVIFGPFSFAESWTSDDFDSAQQFMQWVKPYLDQVDRKDLTWSPVSSTLKTRAGANLKVWKDAADLGNPGAAAYVQSITNQMQDLTARADGLTLTSNLGKRSEGNEVARYDIFNEIAAIIKKVAASTAQAKAAQAAALAAGAELPMDVPVSQNPGSVPGDVTSGGAGVNRPPLTGNNYAATADSSNTLLYVGLGVGALVLIGGGVVLMRKKSSVAGYRRSRRHR